MQPRRESSKIVVDEKNRHRGRALRRSGRFVNTLDQRVQTDAGDHRYGAFRPDRDLGFVNLGAVTEGRQPLAQLARLSTRQVIPAVVALEQIEPLEALAER